ncbi:MAG: hypothetical protein IKS45_10775, partial [Thermoguttaceae bacterium]|nr:hypothetical protein [Thermoguttaceae bacterium]
GEFEGKNLFFKKGRRGAAPSPRYRASAKNRSRWSFVAEASKKLENASTSPPRWIAAVSAAEEEKKRELSLA